MKTRAFSILLALAVVATSASPRPVIAAAPPDEGERLEMFSWLPRLGTPVNREALFARQPSSRVTSTIMIAALGQICMLNSAGAPVSAIYPFGTAYRDALNFALASSDDRRPDTLFAAPSGASIYPFVAWALGPPPSRVGALTNLPFLAAFGLFVAMGNAIGDRTGEVFLGVGPGGPGRVYVIDAARDDMLSFEPFGVEYTGGVRVAAGDLDGDGYSEVITAQASGNMVKAFGYRGGRFVEVGRGTPYGREFTGGVYVAAGDLDNDGVADLVTGAGGGRAHVRAFRIGTEMNGGSRVSVIGDFYAFDGEFANGVRVGVGKIDGTPTIVASAGKDVRAIRPEPSLADMWRMSDFSRNPFQVIGDVFMGLDVYTPPAQEP